MVFNLPGKKPVDFEIVDEWWFAADMQNFTPNSESYCPQKKRGVLIVPIIDIRPPSRRPETPDFKKDRMIHILNGFRNNGKIPPIEVMEITDPDYALKVYDGFHRFFASVAANFTKIPVSIIEPF
jgi:hypothetical protein